MTERFAVIGDIHGNSAALRGVLRLLEDWSGTIVFTGDYVNRGPDSSGVIEMLISLSRNRPDAIFLAGNHDTVLRSAIQSGSISQLLNIGGAPTIKSYVKVPGADVAGQLQESVPFEHLAFLNSLRPWYVSADGLAVTHSPGDNLPDQINVRYRIFGHVPNKNLLPRVEVDWAGIDTGCGTMESGRLTCLFWPSLKVTQVDGSGNQVISQTSAVPRFWPVE
ncbi:metallophosphoesterase [Nocardia sp. BMG111209]|uniref:metallophosphoesterase n=1 Tax=Nocardia sp. BMG111209 TaxID=1160137 RepID=UPI0009DBF1C7|nr:metallophosphoesterase [Nocardia sp. BMG111209]